MPQKKYGSVFWAEKSITITFIMHLTSWLNVITRQYIHNTETTVRGPSRYVPSMEDPIKGEIKLFYEVCILPGKKVLQGEKIVGSKYWHL